MFILNGNFRIFLVALEEQLSYDHIISPPPYKTSSDGLAYPFEGSTIVTRKHV